MKLGYIVTYFSEFFRGPIYHQLEDLSKQIKVTTFTSSEKSYQYYAKGGKLAEKEKTLNKNWKLKRFDIEFKIRGLVWPKNLKPLLHEEKMDIIHSNEYYQPISWQSLKIAKEKKIPFVFTQRRTNVEVLYKPFFWFFDNMSRNVVYESDHIISLTQKGKTLLLTKFPNLSPTKITVIPHSVDLNNFKKLDPEIFRKKLGLRNDDLVLLSVGRIFHKKRTDLLIKALSIIKEDVRNVKLVLVGPEEMREGEKIRKLIKDLDVKDSVIFAGSVPNEKIPHIYALSDVFVTSSLGAGFSYSAIEASACAKPIVAFDTAAFKEIVKDEKNGFLIPWCNIESFAEKTKMLLSDNNLRKRMGKSALKIVKENHSLQKNTKRLIDIYKTLL